MLDPREQKKGGFGARVAREQERHDQLQAATAQARAASTDASFAPPAGPSPGAGTAGAPTPPAGTRSDDTTPG